MKKFLLLISFITSTINFAQIGTLDPNYFANTGTGFTNGNFGVIESFLDSDNKLVALGDFTTFNGNSANRIIKLNEDGTPDTTFDIGTGFNVGTRCIAKQSDGKYLIGGEFTSYRSSSLNSIARLNADGTLDNTFTRTGFVGGGGVNELAIQPDGKIILMGSFTLLDGASQYNGLVRLNTNGSIDTTLPTTAGLGSGTRKIKLLSDGSILLVGTFTSYNGTPVGRILKISATGVLDTAFNTNIGTGGNNEIDLMEIQSDGKILIGGRFLTSFNGTTGRIFRLNTNGTLDTTFLATANGPDDFLSGISLAPNGKIYLGGRFSNFAGSPYTRMVKLNTDGSVDTTFNSTGMSGVPYNFHELADGKVIITGFFTRFLLAEAPFEYTVNHIVRLGDASLSNASSTFSSDLKTYPNPINTDLFIESSTNGTMELFDMNGRAILKQNLTIGTTKIECTGLVTGMYLAKVTNDQNQTKTIKVVKQ